MPEPRTLLDKICGNAHVVAQEPDSPAVLYIDLHLVHEVTSPQAFAGLRQRGLRVRRPERTLATLDHSLPTTDPDLPILDEQAARQVERMEVNARELGVPLHGRHSPRRGIVHVIGPELGLTQPGMTLSVFCVMAQLPEEPMTPRLADDRMGYFLFVHKDFAAKENDFFARYIRKWRVEPDRKRDDLYLPKNPITYYIDPSIPPEFRPYVQAGIEEWNRAFEAAGFENAMRADLLPRDAEPEDLRYATIRWVATDVRPYGAIGPSVVDPRTGEVLDADVLFDASIAQWARADVARGRRSGAGGAANSRYGGDGGRAEDGKLHRGKLPKNWPHAPHSSAQ